MIIKLSPLSKIFLFLIGLVFFSACMLVGIQKPTIEDTATIEDKQISPETILMENFEKWASIPYRNVQIDQLGSDGVFTTLHIEVEFRESPALPWLPSEAVAECKIVGDTWHCDKIFQFQYTAISQTEIAEVLVPTQTSLIQEEETQPTQQAEIGCMNLNIQSEETLIHQMQIDIWPEFDQPGVLIIYHAVLSSFVPLPVDLTFRIPAEAGEPNAVAQMSGSMLLNVAYTRKVSGDWAEISFTAQSSIIQLEYYDPNLIQHGISHHFEYQWQRDYPLDTLIIQVRPPAEAKNLFISPDMDGPFCGELGIYCKNFGAVDSPEVPPIMINYELSPIP